MANKKTIIPNIKVIDDKILCRIEKKEKVQGKIIAPASVSTQPNTTVMEVLATGEGRMLEGGTRNPMLVYQGDRIVVDAPPQMFRISGEIYCVTESFNVIAILGGGTTLDAFQK